MNAPEPIPPAFKAGPASDLSLHHYRVTIEHLREPQGGEPLDRPLVFDTTHQDPLILLFIAERLHAAAATPRHLGLARPL